MLFDSRDIETLFVTTRPDDEAVFPCLSCMRALLLKQAVAWLSLTLVRGAAILTLSNATVSHCRGPRYTLSSSLPFFVVLVQ